VTETFITYVKENCMCCVTNIINWMFWTHDCFHRFDVFAFYKTALVNAFFSNIVPYDYVDTKPHSSVIRDWYSYVDDRNRKQVWHV